MGCFGQEEISDKTVLREGFSYTSVKLGGGGIGKLFV